MPPGRLRRGLNATGRAAKKTWAVTKRSWVATKRGYAYAKEVYNRPDTPGAVNQRRIAPRTWRRIKTCAIVAVAATALAAGAHSGLKSAAEMKGSRYVGPAAKAVVKYSDKAAWKTCSSAAKAIGWLGVWRIMGVALGWRAGRRVGGRFSPENRKAVAGAKGSGAVFGLAFPITTAGAVTVVEVQRIWKKLTPAEKQVVLAAIKETAWAIGRGIKNAPGRLRRRGGRRSPSPPSLPTGLP